MGDKGKKDSTPPPLLLMPAGGGLTLNPPDQPNVLMPVIQSEPSLFGSGNISNINLICQQYAGCHMTFYVALLYVDVLCNLCYCYIVFDSSVSNHMNYRQHLISFRPL